MTLFKKNLIHCSYEDHPEEKTDAKEIKEKSKPEQSKTEKKKTK